MPANLLPQVPPFHALAVHVVGHVVHDDLYTVDLRIEKLFRISFSASARLAVEREGAFHGVALDVDALV